MAAWRDIQRPRLDQGTGAKLECQVTRLVPQLQPDSDSLDVASQVFKFTFPGSYLLADSTRGRTIRSLNSGNPLMSNLIDSQDVRLSERSYWDTIYGNPAVHHETTEASASIGKPLRSRLKRILGPAFIRAMGNYDDHLLWEAILPKFLENRAGQSIVEIGSAPGEFLVAAHQRFGLVPYGIEYSPIGADLNRQVFRTAHLDPHHIIEQDFFSPETHTRYRESFDVVISRGFIEHFTDPADVVAKHLNLLKPGGLLIVSIPNLSGLNFLLLWIFDRQLMAMHNLDIMSCRSFAALFPSGLVTPLFCNYYGTFNLRLINTRPDAVLRVILTLCWKLQPALNVAFHGLFGRRGAEMRWFSPNLLFVGVKR